MTSTYKISAIALIAVGLGACQSQSTLSSTQKPTDDIYYFPSQERTPVNTPVASTGTAAGYERDGAAESYYDGAPYSEEGNQESAHAASGNQASEGDVYDEYYDPNYTERINRFHGGNYLSPSFGMNMGFGNSFWGPSMGFGMGMGFGTGFGGGFGPGFGGMCHPFDPWYFECVTARRWGGFNPYWGGGFSPFWPGGGFYNPYAWNPYWPGYGGGWFNPIGGEVANVYYNSRSNAGMATRPGYSQRSSTPRSTNKALVNGGSAKSNSPATTGNRRGESAFVREAQTPGGSGLQRQPVDYRTPRAAGFNTPSSGVSRGAAAAPERQPSNIFRNSPTMRNRAGSDLNRRPAPSYSTPNVRPSGPSRFDTPNGGSFNRPSATPSRGGSFSTPSSSPSRSIGGGGGSPRR